MMRESEVYKLLRREYHENLDMVLRVQVAYLSTGLGDCRWPRDALHTSVVG